jgi:hypothetical protein
MDSTSIEGPLDDPIFEDILKSIGVFDFDDTAVAALEEAVARFTIDLLCDAKDYSNYCGKPAIDDVDAKLAIETCESNLHRIEDRKIFLRTVAKEINRRSLIDLLNISTVSNKYSHTPSDIASHHRSNNKLLSRTCTLEYGREILDNKDNYNKSENIDPHFHFGSISSSAEVNTTTNVNANSNSNNNYGATKNIASSYINTQGRDYKPFSLRNLASKSRSITNRNVFAESNNMDCDSNS